MHEMLDKLGVPAALAAGIMPQMQDAMDGVSMPGWIAAFAAALLVLTIILEKLGKLPGAGAERRAGGFDDDAARQLKKITDLLAQRIGDSAQERFLLMFERQNETVELLREIRDLLKGRS
jgi:hypothetical protein